MHTSKEQAPANESPVPEDTQVVAANPNETLQRTLIQRTRLEERLTHPASVTEQETLFNLANPEGNNTLIRNIVREVGSPVLTMREANQASLGDQYPQGTRRLLDRLARTITESYGEDVRAETSGTIVAQHVRPDTSSTSAHEELTNRRAALNQLQEEADKNIAAFNSRREETVAPVAVPQVEPTDTLALRPEEAIAAVALPQVEPIAALAVRREGPSLELLSEHVRLLNLASPQRAAVFNELLTSFRARDVIGIHAGAHVELVLDVLAGSRLRGAQLEDEFRRLLFAVQEHRTNALLAHVQQETIYDAVRNHIIAAWAAEQPPAPQANQAAAEALVANNDHQLNPRGFVQTFLHWRRVIVTESGHARIWFDAYGPQIIGGAAFTYTTLQKLDASSGGVLSRTFWNAVSSVLPGGNRNNINNNDVQLVNRERINPINHQTNNRLQEQAAPNAPANVAQPPNTGGTGLLE